MCSAADNTECPPVTVPLLSIGLFEGLLACPMHPIVPTAVLPRPGRYGRPANGIISAGVDLQPGFNSHEANEYNVELAKHEHAFKAVIELGFLSTSTDLAEIKGQRGKIAKDIVNGIVEWHEDEEINQMQNALGMPEPQ